ncbi:MAG: tRNA (N(6)-L-threonylcarbamoyladenosine(37)-C(2))-methylthiotransferase [Candidatus Altiarchaeota archaeon]|nr:tRNA (N(6)-L-threonylcarbamoyladenosine(37)-C(2))-methylthiotransferase [Candidatus Altiarchaeota archaeon]
MAKIGILTYGCAVNQSDSEVMAGLLKEAGFTIAWGSEEPELILVNTCIVKGPTENKIIRKLQDLEKAGKKVIVAGCMPEAYPETLKRFPGFAFLGVNSTDILETVSNFLGHRKKTLKPRNAETKKLRRNRYIAVVPTSQGCLGNCSYCSVKLARGDLKSYTTNSILSQVKDSLDQGAKEVWLTSQDNGCYGLDIGTNLPGLIRQVVALPGEFRVRVGMMNPRFVLDFLDDLVDVCKNEKVYKFIHLPVQSGSDNILRLMNRGYTIDDFKRIVSRFRKELDFTLSTDIIVGFPGETQDDLRKTVDLLEEVKPEVLNLSKYWERKGTKACSMKQLPKDVIKVRGKTISHLFSKISREKEERWKDWEGIVLITGKKDGMYVGRNFAYKPVLVKGGEDLLGKFIDVRITETSTGDAVGEPVKSF